MSKNTATTDYTAVNTATTDDTAVNAALIDVIVIVDNHQHAGQPVKQGDSIQVDQATAQWLRDHKIIQE